MFIELDENFESLIPQDSIIIIGFYENKVCTSCQAFKNDLIKIAKSEQIVAGFIDILKHPLAKLKYGITGSSTCVIYKNGKLMKRFYPNIPNVGQFEKAVKNIKNDMPVDTENDIKNITTTKIPKFETTIIQKENLGEWITQESTALLLSNPINRLVFDGEQYIIFSITT